MLPRLEGKLVVATHNAGKLAEMRDLLAPSGVVALAAAELGLPEPEETGASFISNAVIKARAAKFRRSPTIQACASQRSKALRG